MLLSAAVLARCRVSGRRAVTYLARLAAVLLVGALAPAAAAQTTITLDSSFDDPNYLAVDHGGNVFFSSSSDALKKISAATGAVDTIASGNGIVDGAAFDGAGNLYFFDTGTFSFHGRVYRSPAASGYTVATPIGGSFAQPVGIAVDGAGNVFVADRCGSASAADGCSGTVSEVLAAGGYTSVQILARDLGSIDALAVDAKGNVFVANGDNGAIEELLAASGYVTENSINSGTGAVSGIAVGSSGNLFIVDAADQTVKELTAASGFLTVTTLGSGLSSPGGIAIDRNDNVFVADTGNLRVEEYLAAGGYTAVNTISTRLVVPTVIAVDGNDNFFTNVAPLFQNPQPGLIEFTASSFYQSIAVLFDSGLKLPAGVAVDSSNNLFFADNRANTVTEVFAQTGYTTEATIGSGFLDPAGVAVDGSGNVFVADTGNGAVKEMLAAGSYATVKTLGSGFVRPLDVALDGTGNVFVYDAGIFDVTGPPVGQVYEIPASGGYTTVKTLPIGTTALNAITADANGNVFAGYSSEYYKGIFVQPAEVVEFAAANNYMLSKPLGTGIGNPIGLAVDTAGNIFVADSGHVKEILAQAPPATTTALTASANPAAFGQSISFTATVTASSGAVTGGTMAFTDGPILLGAVPVAGGTASLSVSALSAGSHSITASYGGSSADAPSASSAVTEVIAPPVNLPAVTLAVSPNPAAVGQNIVMTATVTGTGGLPSGTVTFTAARSELDMPSFAASVPLFNGIASLVTTALPQGSYSITAIYSGDAAFDTAQSPPAGEIVAVPPEVTLTSSLNPSRPGESIVFTAMVSPVGGSTYGTITIYDGTTALGSSPVTYGYLAFLPVTLSTDALSPGNHSITAVYSGDAGDPPSSSAVLTQSVVQPTGTPPLYLYQATLGTTGAAGTDNGHFNHPVASAVDTVNRRLLVADTGNHRVQVLDLDTLTVIGTIGVTGVSGTGAGYLNHPTGVGYDPATDTIYIADSGNQRIQTWNGRYLVWDATLGVTGVTGSDNGHFNTPLSAQIDPTSGRLLVADSGNHRVQVFDAGSFAYLGTLGTSGVAGSDSAHLNHPADAVANPAAHQILVADTGNLRVQIFDAASLAPVGTIGAAGVAGADAFHFALPQSVGFDPVADLVLVADGQPNQRVQVFDAATYVYTTTFGTAGTAGAGAGQFNGPDGFAVDPASDRLFVGDSLNQRVQVFSITPPPPAASYAKAPMFLGNGKADIVWQNASGDVDLWLMNGASVAAKPDLGIVPPDLKIVGTGDFNGDGKSDLLLRDENGDVQIWLMNGGSVLSKLDLGVITNDWTIAGTGDFNGDGSTDILWRNANGRVFLWLMVGGKIGALIDLGTMTSDWTIAGTGDFDGTGTTDILWRNADGRVAIWLMKNGQVASSSVIATVSTDWTIIGTGDFTAGGRSDILWRNADGQTVIWFMDGTTLTDFESPGTLSTAWYVAGIGDFNGAGQADILWRNIDGDVMLWFMEGGMITSQVDLGVVPTDWRIVE